MQNRIKEWRTVRGMTLEQLGAACNTSSAQAQRLEAGTRRLTDMWLTKLSKALQVSKASLLIDNFVPPGFTPRKGDLAENETERRLLAFWRSLSPAAQDFILTMVDLWAERFGDDE